MERLRLRRQRGFHDLVAEAGDVIVAITMFLAVLELVRQRRLSLRQQETFGPIELRMEGGPGDSKVADTLIGSRRRLRMKVGARAYVRRGSRHDPFLARLEAVLLVAGDAATVEGIARALGVSNDAVEEGLDALDRHYAEGGHGVACSAWAGASARHGPGARGGRGALPGHPRAQGSRPPRWRRWPSWPTASR